MSDVVDNVERIYKGITETTTCEELNNLVIDVQSRGQLTLADRGALAFYVVCKKVTDYKEIPAILERYGEVLRNVRM